MTAALCWLLGTSLKSQPDRWQQRVKYNMEVKMDVTTHRFTGTQRLEYFNHSPDTLYKVFYHLYWNAFQPNSMMDVRSRTIEDPDRRVRDRIFKLKPEEIGYDSVMALKMNGRPVKFRTLETILEVILDKPILPHSKAVFDMAFKGQVPVQIRRSGRDNAEGIAYSMSQWYPKICEYDYEGWHPTPYVGREFYGVWGDYDVKITIDRRYVLGATGYLQNADQIGYGYEAPGTKLKRPNTTTLTWHFFAPNVHDFMWAADPDYRHLVKRLPDGRVLNFLYQENEHTKDTWPQLAEQAVKALPFIENFFGKYPYQQYSFIQGGDGGMEYPMGTLILGESKFSSLLGTAMHEWMHSWYQMLLATNESLYPWMDEGFTSWGAARVMQFLSDTAKNSFPHEAAYKGYFALARSGKEEPMTTHSDHYETNFAYSLAAYAKGEVFLEQLGYVIGEQVRNKGLLRYYELWHFKHPNSNDFIRVMEEVSGLKLDWYKEYFVQTIKTINYGIDSVYEENGSTYIRLRRIGFMPMPIDLMITYQRGNQELHYIPMNLMFGEKPQEQLSVPRKIYAAWPWVNPTYTIVLPVRLWEIKTIEIDPSRRMADVDRSNNKLEIPTR